MSKKCLLIQTKDGKKFLTSEKHLPMLIEFAKTFCAEIHLVEANMKEKVLDLKPLTASLCNPEYKAEPKYKAVERLYPKSKRTRKSILEDAKIIRRHIRDKMLAGQPVSLKDLKEAYKNHGLTDACLCNHLTAVRKDLVIAGQKVQKLGAGKYKVIEDTIVEKPSKKSAKLKMPPKGLTSGDWAMPAAVQSSPTPELPEINLQIESEYISWNTPFKKKKTKLKTLADQITSEIAQDIQASTPLTPSYKMPVDEGSFGPVSSVVSEQPSVKAIAPTPTTYYDPSLGFTPQQIFEGAFVSAGNQENSGVPTTPAGMPEGMPVTPSEWTHVSHTYTPPEGTEIHINEAPAVQQDNSHSVEGVETTPNPAVQNMGSASLDSFDHFESIYKTFSETAKQYYEPSYGNSLAWAFMKKAESNPTQLTFTYTSH